MLFLFQPELFREMFFFLGNFTETPSGITSTPAALFWLAKTFRVIFRYRFSDIRQNNFSLNDIFTWWTISKNFRLFPSFFFYFTFYVSKRSKIGSNGTLKFDFFLYENYNQYKTQLMLHAWLNYLQFSVTKIAYISPILLLFTKYQTVKICYCLPWFYCYFEKLSPSEVNASKSLSHFPKDSLAVL